MRSLQFDLSSTEQKLLNATHELKKMAPGRNTPEPFRDDNKFKIRQKLARKMQAVSVFGNIFKTIFCVWEIVCG